MFDCNLIKQRCLVLSKDSSFITRVEELLLKTGLYSVDTATDRKIALLLFLQCKHSIVLLDEDFLPRFPHRLHLFYKIAHRTPGIIIFRKTKKDLSGYCFLTEGFVEIIDMPFANEKLMLALKQTDRYMRLHSKSIFFRGLLIHVGLAVPVLLLLAVLLL
ncbi:MAG: hypothetical protein GX267_04170 [Fibrobacter sp.]|jgi:DNA-binding NtrC family response regulator|nr:hypothetical protein [Fibrobacter sp.]